MASPWRCLPDRQYLQFPPFGPDRFDHSLQLLSDPHGVGDMTIQRVEHVVVVVDDFEAAISFFVEVGMELDRGTTPVEGDWWPSD